MRPSRPQKFGLESTKDLTFGLICIMLLEFSYLFIASALLGMAFGLVTAYCLRHFHFHHVSQARRGAGASAALRRRGRGLWAAEGLRALLPALAPPPLLLLPPTAAAGVLPPPLLPGYRRWR